MPVATGPWQMVGMDTIGPLPTSAGGYKYLVVMVDYFTRYVEAEPIVEQTTEELLRVFMKCVVCRHGMPERVLTDRGSPYISEVAQQMFNRMGVQRLMTTAYRPQTNGVVERINRVIKETLRAWVNKALTDWDVLYPFAVFAINTAHHSAIGQTPFFLDHLRQARTPLDIALGRLPPAFEGYDQYVAEMSRIVFQTYQTVSEIWSERAQAQEDEAANAPPPPIYAAGERVWLCDMTEKNKLMPKWLGPFTVVAKKSDRVYEIDLGNSTDTVNVTRLKPYLSHPLPATRDAIQLEREIGQYRSMLEVSTALVTDALKETERVKSQIAALAEEQRQLDEDRQRAAMPDTSASSTDTHTHTTTTITTTTTSSTTTTPATIAAKPRRHRTKTFIPRTAPTYTGILRPLRVHSLNCVEVVLGC